MRVALSTRYHLLRVAAFEILFAIPGPSMQWRQFEEQFRKSGIGFPNAQLMGIHGSREIDLSVIGVSALSRLCDFSREA